MALFRLPEISTEVMDVLRNDETPTALSVDEFEASQPNVCNGLKKAMGDGDEYLAAVTDMSIFFRALELEMERRLA